MEETEKTEKGKFQETRFEDKEDGLLETKSSTALIDKNENQTKDKTNEAETEEKDKKETIKGHDEDDDEVFLKNDPDKEEEVALLKDTAGEEEQEKDNAMTGEEEENKDGGDADTDKGTTLASMADDGISLPDLDL